MGRVTRPGRRAAPVPEPDSVLGRFAQRLRTLRDQAGDPGYQALADETERLGYRYSETSLRNAASGRVRPSWEVTEMFVRACAAFALAHPERAGETARRWKARELVDEWVELWREMAFAENLTGPGAAQPPQGGARPGAPGARGPSGSGGNLPTPLTSFVGREEELAAGSRMLRLARLVTVTGTGGVGKTRFALRLAERAGTEFRDGVWLVELADLGEPDMVERAVATALGIQAEPGQEPSEVVVRVLTGRRVLLVLDNCEHLLDAGARLVRSLLRAVPHLCVLATSRQPLDVGGEHVLPIAPLALPRQRDPADGAGPGDHTQSAAVALFTDRAVAAVPGFRVGPGNQAAVVRLCRRLDGLPLALEIAARGLRTLTVDELLERLDQRFLPLGRENTERAVHTRHQTLGALFDWSHQLCSPGERRAWGQLSVCAGGVSLADAEALCADPGGDPPSGFRAIAGLVDKSLLTRTESGGRSRLHMLETVRRYGLERLAAEGREGPARRRHGEHFLGLARQAAAEYASPRQPEWLLRLRSDHANIRQALMNGLEDPSATEAVLSGACGLWLSWTVSDASSEGVLLMRRLVGRYPRPPSSALAPVWCQAMWGAAHVLLLHGDRTGGQRLLDRVETVVTERQGGADGWLGLEAAVLQLRGLATMFTGDVETTERHLRAALRAEGRCAPLLTDQQSLAQLGFTASMRGDGARAADLLRQALVLSEGCGEVWHRSYVLWALALEYTGTGRNEEAGALLRDSLAIKRRLGDRLGEATVSETLACVLTLCGDARAAAVLFGAAYATWRPLGTPQLFGFTHLIAYRERTVATTRRMLGEGPFEEAYREGERLGLTRALEEVLR